MLGGNFEKLFWLFGVCILLNVALAAGVVFRLKTSHPSMWETIGSPGYFGPRRVGDFQLLRFISKMKFLKMRDPLLITLGILSMFSFFCGAVLFAFVWLSAGDR